MSNQLPIQSRLLKLLLRDGPLTRPQCVKELQVRPATLLSAINALKRRWLVREPSRTGLHTGRKAPLLELVPDCLWSVGLEVRADGMHGVVVDATGRIRYSKLFIANYKYRKEDFLSKLFATVDELQAQCGDNWRLVKGFGFADPGLVDMEKGVSLRAVNIPGWQDLRVKEELERRYGLPARLWPECSVSTHLEYLQRTRELGSGSLFYLGMGAGIGGGFIRNGELFFGDQNMAMEIGHVIVRPDGPPCQCGNRGCLEAIAGWRGILRRREEAWHGHVNSAMNVSTFGLAEVIQWHRTDKLAHNIANEVCESIGTALATVVTLLNPSCIVMRGELTGLGDFLLDTVWRVLKANCFPDALRQLRLELSSLPPDEVARGAALLMRDRLLLAELEAP